MAYLRLVVDDEYELKMRRLILDWSWKSSRQWLKDSTKIDSVFEEKLYASVKVEKRSIRDERLKKMIEMETWERKR